ncbi:MAG: hypothetical protein EZS28_024944 [Streblomastix strix]|uniref:Uncharacterized protein n=1 Tax=Streblomastix strix TaxID=222440 RepID=A0A5J4VAN0_9EUKA|nr:MAG: hypothetical protein EZS28_024944 [Streblomastix strix]
MLVIQTNGQIDLLEGENQHQCPHYQSNNSDLQPRLQVLDKRVRIPQRLEKEQKQTLDHVRSIEIRQ